MINQPFVYKNHFEKRSIADTVVLQIESVQHPLVVFKCLQEIKDLMTASNNTSNNIQTNIFILTDY